jgi:hypothetical protein
LNSAVKYFVLANAINEAMKTFGEREDAAKHFVSLLADAPCVSRRLFKNGSGKYIATVFVLIAPGREESIVPSET